MSSSQQILIVDDEVDICANMADILTDAGYLVDVAHDGQTAVSLVESRRYDIALLDLMMPGMDGAAVYQEIKRLRPETTAIVVTAYPEHPRASAAISKGAWKILPKPLDLSKLFLLIEEAFDQPLLLVVDDDPDFCESLWDLLHERGYRIAIAHNTATARQLLVSNGDYQLVLLDMKLPDGDGGSVLDFAECFKPSVPILVITGYPTEYQPQFTRKHALSVLEILAKPLDVPRLLQSVRQLTAGHDQH